MNPIAAAVSTHYVNLPHWLALSWPEVERQVLRPDAQHSAWQWLDAGQARSDEGVHPYVCVCGVGEGR